MRPEKFTVEVASEEILFPGGWCRSAKPRTSLPLDRSHKAKMSASIAASVSISSAATLRAGRAQRRATVAKAARADANNEVRHRGISTDWTLSVVIHFPRPRGSEPIV